MSIDEIYVLGLVISAVVMFFYTFIGGFSVPAFIRNMLVAVFWPIMLPIAVITAGLKLWMIASK
jgi:hypothetical protein